MRIEFPPPAKCLTMNQRLHWAAKAKLSRAWRDAAADGCRAADWYVDPRDYDHVTPLEPSIVTVYLPVKGNRRRDPHNWFPTVKPCVDGLVDAGLFPDDTPEWVRCMEPVLVVNGDTVVIELKEMT